MRLIIAFRLHSIPKRNSDKVCSPLELTDPSEQADEVLVGWVASWMAL